MNNKFQPNQKLMETLDQQIEVDLARPIVKEAQQRTKQLQPKSAID